MAETTVTYNGANDYEPDSGSLTYPWTKSSYGTFSTAVENDASCDNGKRFKIDTPDSINCNCHYEHIHQVIPGLIMQTTVRVIR